MEYTILATHTNQSGKNWEVLVAIESAPNHYKAYYQVQPNFPTWEDVMNIAGVGTKLSPKAAALTFAELATAHKYDY